MNQFRSYRVDTSEYVVVNLQYCIENYQILFDFVRYYWREVIIISDHFESIRLDFPSNENEIKVFSFIKENLHLIRLCDLNNFDTIGFKYYIKNGLISSGNFDIIKFLIEQNIAKTTNFLFLSNRVKNFRLNLLNFLVQNEYDKKICIKFNNSDAGHSITPKVFENYDDKSSIIKIPYMNKKFIQTFGKTEQLFTENHTYQPSDLSNAVRYCLNSKFFISSESTIYSYCVSEKILIPLLSNSIPLMIMCSENYNKLSKIGIDFNYFFIDQKITEYSYKLKRLLDISDDELDEYYNYYKREIAENFNIMKKLIYED